jgi:hypothetical protein
MMMRMAILFAVGAAVLAFTQPVHAQGADEQGPGSSADSEPAVEVRNRSEWAATDDSMRPPVGTAILRPRLVLPDTYGTWAQPPVGFATTSVALFAGELALSSRWSAVFDGAKDSLDQRFSGGVVGLRLHLTPREAPIQLSLSGGAMRDLIGGSGFWSRINVSHEVGRWRFAGMLRAYGLAGDAQTWLSGSGGVSYDLRQVRVGVEYAAEQSKVVARSAVMAWVAMPIAKGPFQLRLTAVVPTFGNDGASLRLSFVSDF